MPREKNKNISEKTHKDNPDQNNLIRTSSMSDNIIEERELSLVSCTDDSRTPTKDVEEHEESNDTDPEAECNATFDPVVSLELKETLTGQENEKTLLDMKCKLYRFEASTHEWKERGIGKVQILEHKENQPLRLLMRQEKILKVRANHILLPGTKLLSKGNDTCWVWSALDFAEGSPMSEKFCIRFGTSSKAEEFKKVFDLACEKNSKFITEKIAS